jgi:hypothetical protein
MPLVKGLTATAKRGDLLPKKAPPAKPTWRPFERMALDAQGKKYSLSDKQRPTYK